MREQRPNYDFSDKAVLVTGGTSGMGRAVAEAFAAAGANLLVTGRDQDRGAAVSASVSRHGGQAFFIAGDISDSGFCRDLVGHAVDRLGRVDIVVNSAGVIYHGTAEETGDAWWQDTLAVNVSGLFYVCRAAIPELRKSGGGVIINIASDAGLTASRHLVAYCASKGAVIQLSRAMALDHAGEGIRIIPVCPGDVDTPMLRGEFEQRGIDAQTGLAESAQGVPLNRVCSAQEVADLVLYAASPAARFMTGYPLVLDGGSRA